MLRVVDRSGKPSRLRTLYAGLPGRLTPEAFAQSVHETLAPGQIDVIIAATVMSDRARFPLPYFNAALTHPSLAHVRTRVIADELAVRLDEYRVAER